MGKKLMILTLLMAVVAAARVDARERGRDRENCTGRRSDDGLVVIGLTVDQRLVCFEEDDPEKARNLGPLSGFTGDTSLVGIDFRPATGELYGLGNAGGIYVIDVATAAATFKSQLSVMLAGASFGVDFNPTVDRLRVISDTGQNLRVNVDTGVAAVDAVLNYPAAATGVTGAAYTNNDADSNTATTLYDIDSVLDQVVIQAPPNNGSLNPTGKLTVDGTDAVGFDIYSKLRNGATLEVDAFASLTTNGRSRFFRINLATGQARQRGAFRSRDRVVDIALPLNQR